MGNVLVSMKGIDKQFPGVRALNQCHFELRSGEANLFRQINGDVVMGGLSWRTGIHYVKIQL